MVKYEIVMNGIMDRIENGIWKEGMPMPTEYQLCALYDVSRITVRRALDELERRGCISRVQGKGTFVKRRPLESAAGHKGFKNAMAEEGIIIESRLITREIMKAPDFVADKLGLSPDERVWHFIRVRKAGETPLAYMETWVGEELGDIMIASNLSEESFYDLYRRIYGIPVEDTSGYITAVNAKGWMAKYLGLEENDAAILFKSVAYLEDERPVQVDHSYFSPKTYQFAYNLNGKNNAPIRMGGSHA